MRRFNHKNGMLLKHVKASFNHHECSSGDEGYVGSYSSSTSDNNRLLMTKLKHSPRVPSDCTGGESRTTMRPFVPTSAHQMTSDIQDHGALLSESHNKTNLNRLLNALQANLNKSAPNTLADPSFPHSNAHERAKGLNAIANDMLAVQGYDLSIYDSLPDGQHFNYANSAVQGSFDEHMRAKVEHEDDDGLEYNDDIANMNEFVDLECSSLEECESTQLNDVKIEIPNLFGHSEERVNSEQDSLDNSVFFKLHDEDKFDIAHNLSLNESMLGSSNSLDNVVDLPAELCCCCHVLNECVCTQYKANEAETKQLMFDLFNRQVELEQLEELAMYGKNWRVILEQRRAKESQERQMAHEDHVDLNAYLNEIQMNVDYYQTDTCDESMVDTLLRFRDNEMAFNLRLNHNAIEHQRQQRRVQQQQRVKRVKSLLYANFDSIPEFVMPSHTSASDEFACKSTNPVNTVHGSEDVNEESEEGGDTLTDHTRPMYADEAMFMGDEANNYFDSTICGDESDNNQNCLHTTSGQVVNNDTTFCVDSQLFTNEYETDEHLMLMNPCEDEYVYNEEHMFYDEQFYDEQSYEDQVYIDSLSDKEVLSLLRKESELYALKMSQASKTGILNRMPCADEPYEQEQEFVDHVDSEEFNQANLDTEEEQVELSDEFAPQLDAQSDLVPVEMVHGEFQMPSSVDMFENVYTHYAEQPNEFQFQLMYDNANPEDFVHVDENTSSDEVLMAPSYEPSITHPSNEFDYEFMPSEEGTSDHQMSLRNSLLRLRQSRRHLERLIEQSKMASNSDSATSCSSASSTTGSFRTGSSMSLYKQHMLTMSKKPCVYILNEGRCMRSDCRFVHDLKTITCKYWLEGECLKGESCEFAHELIQEAKTHGNKHKHGKQQSSNKKVETVKKDFKLDSEEFPALGAAPVQTTVQNVVQLGTEKQGKESSPVTTSKASVDKNVESSQTSPQQQTTKASIANIVKQQQQPQPQPQPAKTIASVLLSNVVSSKSQANVGAPKTLSNIVKTPAVSIVQTEKQSSSLTLNNTNKQQNVSQNNNSTTKGSITVSGSENTTGKGKKNKKSNQKELLKQTASNSRTNSCTRKK